MANTSSPTRPVARDYLRVSLDRTGREASPERQHRENKQHADQHGLKLGPSYKDIGSASKSARKVRDDFEKLMSNLKNGTFNAEIWRSGSLRVDRVAKANG